MNIDIIEPHMEDVDETESDANNLSSELTVSGAATVTKGLKGLTFEAYASQGWD